MGGYENYGGGRPYGWQTWAAIAIFAAVVAGYWWVRR